MNNSEEKEWVFQVELGKGGFGSVCLYSNKTTNEYLAIKRPHERNHDIDGSGSSIWDRWRVEVEMMKKLNHPNVIKAVPVPSELYDSKNQILLGMEYCQGGDLRKMLMRPENVYGLRESYIRDLLSGVGSAIEYLHKIRIIHRDIKPENIVLQPTEEENRFVYKIIDVGYAKELDASSFCNSHVGTQQYLAPEFNAKQGYTRTVDYWSFGSLVYECITGKRPFLPDLISTVQWYKEVEKKDMDDISAYYDEFGAVKYSKVLPRLNYLCRTIRKYLEQWLRLMLRWDPKIRGGGVKKLQNNEERPKCFCILEQVLETKIFHVFHAKTNLLMSFPVKEGITIEVIHQAIEVYLGISLDQQLLVDRNGNTFQAHQFAFDACEGSTTETPSLFLFTHGEVSKVKRENEFPPPLEAIVQEPNTILTGKNQRAAWKSAVYWCVNENDNYKQLVSSQRAAMLAVLRTISFISKQVLCMKDEMKKLVAFKEFFQTSLDYDLLQYQKPANQSGDLNSIKVQTIQLWIPSPEQDRQVHALEHRATEQEKQTQEFMDEVLELQKKPSKDSMLKKLAEFEKEAKALYEKLKASKAPNDNREHQPMVNVVGKCFADRSSRNSALNESTDKVLDLFHRLKLALPEIDNLIKDIEREKDRLKMMQTERQGHIWKLSSKAVDNTTNQNSRAVEQSLQNVAFLPDSASNQNSMFNGSASLMVSLTSNLNSVRLVDDSKTCSKRMHEMLVSMMKEQDESIQYFSCISNSNSN